MSGLSSSAKYGIPTVLKYKFNISVVIIGKAGKGLSSSAKSGVLTVLKYKFHISIVKVRKAGKEIGNLP